MVPGATAADGALVATTGIVVVAESLVVTGVVVEVVGGAAVVVATSVVVEVVGGAVVATATTVTDTAVLDGADVFGAVSIVAAVTGASAASLEQPPASSAARTRPATTGGRRRTSPVLHPHARFDRRLVAAIMPA